MAELVSMAEEPTGSEESCVQVNLQPEPMNTEPVPTIVEPIIYPTQTKSGKSFVKYPGIPDPAYPMDDLIQCRYSRESELLFLLSEFSSDEIQNLGPYRLRTASGDIELSSYEQFLLKIAGEYYVNLPGIRDSEIVVKILHYWLRVTQGRPAPNRDVIIESAYIYMLNSGLGSLITVLSRLVLNLSLMVASDISEVRIEGGFKTITDACVKDVPIIDGALRMVQAIVLNRRESIEPIHPLLKADGYFGLYMSILARGDHSFHILSKVIAPIMPWGGPLDETVRRDFPKPLTIEAERDHPNPTEDIIRTETSGGLSFTIRPIQPLGDAPNVFQRSGPEASLHAEQVRLGKQPMPGLAPKLIVPEPSNQVLLPPDRGSQSHIIRDTSNFQISTVFENDVRNLLTFMHTKIDRLDVKLDALSQRISKLNERVVKQYETTTILIARSAQDNLATRETINQSLLQQAGQPTRPIPASNLDQVIGRLQSYPANGDSVSSLLADVHRILILHNQTTMAANLNEQQFKNSGAKLRLIHSLNRLSRM